MLRLALVPVLLVSLLLTSCAPKKGGPGGPGGFHMPPMPVEVAEARPQTVRDEFRALGSIESDEIIDVVSELAAKVVSLPFVEGQAVAKGMLLVQLDDREFRADAARTEAQREQAASNAKRSESLFEQHAISSQELDDAHTSLKVAEANEALAKARLAKTRISAPWSGLVGRRRVSPGAYLKSGDIITELAHVDEMKVSFTAPERYMGEIHLGRPVQVSTPAFPGETFVGKVTVVDPIVNPESRTFQLVARIPNPERKLRPGMSANATVIFAERTRALTVPDEAVFAQGNQNFVYVVKADSSVSRTAIELGTRDSSSVEVVRGLDPGARVVRAGHQKLFDGAKVMPISDQAPGMGTPSRPGAARPKG